MLSKKSAFCIFLLCVLALFTFGEEKEEDNFDFNFNIGLGVETFKEDGEDATYQKVALAPDISIGNLGIGMDLTIHYNFEKGKLAIREADWVPEDPTFLNVLELYMNKFKYIRWAQKGAPLYAKFGSIEDGMIGNGFVLGGYANTLFLPDTRVLGLSLDVDGTLFNFPIMGFETFFGNIVNWDVIGARFFVRPMGLTEIPILNLLEIGVVGAFDIDPFRYASTDEMTAAAAADIDTDDAQAVFLGMDFQQPLPLSELFPLVFMGDFSSYKGQSYGGMVGFGGSLLKFVNYSAMMLFIGEGFVPNYFNSTYDLNRGVKYLLMEGDNITPAYNGWMVSMGFDILGIVNFNATLDGPFGTVDSDNPDNYLNNPHLMGTLTVSDGIIPGLSMEGSYDKINIEELADIIDPTGAVIMAKINYQTGPAVISLFYQVTYEAGNWQTQNVTSGLESVIQLN